jgi:HK97 family phage major capsid protein
MRTSDTAVRDKLRVVRDRIAEARSERVEAVKEVDSAKEAFAKADLSDSDIISSDEFKAAEQATKKVGEIDDKLHSLEEARDGIIGMLGAKADREDPDNANNPSEGNRNQLQRYGWDAHRLLKEADEFNEAKERGMFSSQHKFGTIHMGEMATREEAMAFLAGAGTLGAALPGAPAGPVGTPSQGIPPDFRGIVPPRVRRLTLLDIIPTGTTDSNSVEYVQVSAIPFGAAETAELAMKPELGMTTTDATAPVRTIAGWVKAARQALDDMAGLATLINTLLPYEVRRRVEAQILAGDGVGQNLLGILNTTGIGQPAGVAGDNAADAILRAMTVVILSDSDPNFCAINPLTWQNLLLLREQTNDQAQALSWKGEYLYGQPGTLATPTLWGLTLTPSRIIGTNNPLVGDAMGASLLVREGLNIKTSDSDQDDFVRNRVTILAETRVALPVWRPSAFAQATF